MLRWVFIGIAVFSFGTAAFIELIGSVHAQAVPAPVLVLATIPPAPTPLPKMQYPRELFQENAASSDPATITTGIPAAGAPTAPGTLGGVSPLASYGIVTVSADAANADNSYALISTPHGIDLKRNQDIEDGFRIISITDRGVLFQGGVFIPVGYSQSSNPSVPPVGGPIVGGGSFPNTTVPVSINGSQAQPAASAPTSVTRPYSALASPPPSTMTQTNGLQVLPSPSVVNPQQSLPGPQFINPGTPIATPSPGI